MARLHRTGILLGSCAAFMLGCPDAAGQVGFFGAPPPSDADADLDAAGSGLSQGAGVFARKPFRLTFAVREGFDSNVFQTSENPVGSFYTNWAAGLNYATGTPRLQVETSLGAGLTYYYTRPGEKVDGTGLFDLRVTYLVTPRLTLALEHLDGLSLPARPNDCGRKQSAEWRLPLLHDHRARWISVD